MDAIMPAFWAICMSPTQSAMTPSIVMQSVTASFALSSAALLSSAIWPVSDP